jgi:hypothetical protein
MTSPETGVTTVSDKQEEPARLSPHQRLIGTLFSPGETFQDINRKPDWILPLIVAMIFSFAGNFIIINRVKPDWEQLGRKQVEQRLQKQGKSLSDLSEEQRQAIEKQVKFGSKFSSYFVYIVPVFVPVLTALLALLFWGSALLFGGQTTYKKVFSVSLYTNAVVIVVATIVNIVVAFLRNPEDIDLTKGAIAVTNPGMLMPPETSAILIALLSQLDIFTIWYLILITIGISAVSKNLKPSMAAAAVFSLWAIWVVVRVGIAAVFG